MAPATDHAPVPPNDQVFLRRPRFEAANRGEWRKT